ncbi:Pfs domain protein [Lasiodiplodia theobromae]|uniref:Pfs domain protein n=1 Tax=Lasiodiplodia theobromae TaxID=45133 RepID=UPI0015C3C5CD|nr:Pfs domain protein [Lasiodiplodia theobromae]KAF4541614.1 Pfs domain protein [Lasiodiplodia theobromae]
MNDDFQSCKKTNDRNPAQSDSGYHSGIGTDTASICSIDSIGSLADVSPSFLQEFVEFFSRMLIEKAGAFAWAKYAVSVHSADVIEKHLGDLLKSYAIGLSHLATDAVAAGDGLDSKFSHLQEYSQFSLQERIDLLNKMDGNFESDEKSDSDDDEDFLDLDAAREILISGQPFRQLAVSMRRAFYCDENSKLSEIERCVRGELMDATEINPDLPKPTVAPLHKASFSI